MRCPPTAELAIIVLATSDVPASRHTLRLIHTVGEVSVLNHLFDFVFHFLSFSLGCLKDNMLLVSMDLFYFHNICYVLFVAVLTIILTNDVCDDCISSNAYD